MEMYNVYRVDVCWDDYGINDVLVGAKSREDLLDHITDIWPDVEYKITRENWMSEEDWQEECEYGKYKEGDVINEPYFTNEQIKDLQDNSSPTYSRITLIEHLYTDTPYTILDGFGYIE